jgi:TPR repeat protein
MYLNGRGVPRDEVQAAALFQKAADQGDERAKNNLALLEEMRSLTQKQSTLQIVLVAAVVAFALLIAFSIVRERARLALPAQSP